MRVNPDEPSQAWFISAELSTPEQEQMVVFRPGRFGVICYTAIVTAT